MAWHGALVQWGAVQWCKMEEQLEQLPNIHCTSQHFINCPITEKSWKCTQRAAVRGYNLLDHTLSIWLEIKFTSNIFLNISLGWLIIKSVWKQVGLIILWPLIFFDNIIFEALEFLHLQKPGFRTQNNV